LREISFAPLKDCKEALAEANDDLALAQDILRKKGIAKAGNRAERETNEGIVKIDTRDGWIVGLKLCCETDFVAKNENFQQIFDNIFDQLASQKQDAEKLEDLDPTFAETILSQLQEFVGKTGENMKIGAVLLSSRPAFVYNHPGNRVATIIEYVGDDQDVAKEIALQVTAMNPQYISFDQVDKTEVAQLTQEFTAELKDAGKPEAMIANIVEAKIKKVLAENVLFEQEYIRDPSKKIKDILPAGFQIIGFKRIALGS